MQKRSRKMIQNRRQKSVMKHDFSRVPSTQIPRSNFRRSHGYKTTLSSGLIIPIYVDEALPGDTFNLRMSHVARLATPIVPFLDNTYLNFFFFACPLRLVWDNFQKFMGEQDNPSDTTDYLCPTVTAPAGGFTIGSLADYFGLPVLKENITPDAFHFRAHNLIYNQWFRSQDLQDSVVVPKDDGPDDSSLYELYRRTKRYDYFTSALPFPQKGPSVELPLGDRAAVRIDDITGYDTGVDGDYYTANQNSSGVTVSRGSDIYDTIGTVFSNSGAGHLYADLSEAVASNVNNLREAFQLQRLLERDARGGTRYREILMSHFKTDTGDARLQRPEYLGGGTAPLNVTPIPQTTPTGIVDGVTPQGNLAAIGYSSNSGIGFTKSFVEHSVVIGYVSINADLTYQNTLSRMWTRQTKYDFYWPALAFLGEQEILRQEIDCTEVKATNEEVWGYNERWSEYRYFPSKITGKMRSIDPQSLDVWHLSEDLIDPQLNEDFIQSNPPISRVIAVPSEPEFVFDSYFDLICTRPIPAYSPPGLIDHY